MMNAISVRDFGAAGDGVTLDTGAIQAAIESCTNMGGGSQEEAQRAVPELRDCYPEYHMFGTLPAYGVYLRHVKGLTFEDVTLATAAPDLRPALLRLRETRQVYLHGCCPLNEIALFLRVEGAGSQGILLQANDLRLAGQVYTLAEGASAEAIIKD